MVACHFNFQFQILIHLKGTNELCVAHFIMDTPLEKHNLQIGIWFQCTNFETIMTNSIN